MDVKVPASCSRTATRAFADAGYLSVATVCGSTASRAYSQNDLAKSVARDASGHNQLAAASKDCAVHCTHCDHVLLAGAAVFAGAAEGSAAAPVSACKRFASFC